MWSDPVTLTRDYRILLSTDKPLYQPGQIIHLRALALSTFDLTPAVGEEMELIIADGKGNTVHRETQTTSEFGVAFTDFQLADQVNNGNFKITVVLNGVSSEKTVTVEPYVLPKFEVTLNTDKPFYQPGEHVNATLDAAYFFGKTVNNANIEIEGFTFDFERQEAFTMQGTTDAEGQFSFEFDVPDYVIGSDLDGGMGSFYLQAHVTDQTNHTESSGRTFPVTSSSLIIEAIPEGGQFKPNVENILYVLTSYPDGRPAPTTIDIQFYTSGEQVSVETGEYGLAEIPYTPTDSYQEIYIVANDAQGNEAQRDFYFEGNYQQESVLLRPDRPAYQIGETMNLAIYTSQLNGTAYLDIIREGQTVSTRAVQIEDGQAEVAVDVTPELFGTVELHAYKILRSGNFVRDTRIVLIDQANDLALTFNSDKEEYRPGETAVLDINVTGQDGEGAHSAIGLAVVDEAVFALSEQDPGFAKLYFMLEEELLQPKYELHGFSVPDLMITEPVTDASLRQAQEGAAQASLAETSLSSTNFSLNVNSRDENMAKVWQQQEDYFTNLSKLLLGLILLLPLASGIITAVFVWRAGQFWQKLGLMILLCIFSFICLYGLITLVDQYLWRSSEVVSAMMGLSILVSFIALLVVAWRNKDKALGWMIALSALFIPLLMLTVFISSLGDLNLDDSWGWIAFFILLLLPLSFMLRSADFVMERRWITAVAALIIAISAFAFPVAGLFAQSGGVGFAAAQPQMVEVTRVVTETAVETVDVMFEAEEEASPDSAASTTADAQGSEPPRLRQYFPETMLWLPDAETNENGQLTLDIPVADSITTWRLTALASTQDGRLGSGTSSLRVFQDFFIDLDLPLALTVGDEVSIPVGVFNYLPESQSVNLQLQQEDWFQLLDEAEKTIVVEPNEISCRLLPHSKHKNSAVSPSR